MDTVAPNPPQHADLGNSLDYLMPSKPCRTSGDGLKGMDAQQLQDEINLTMAAGGYQFKNPQVGERMKAELEKRGIPYNPKPDFDEQRDLSSKDRDYIESAKVQKALLNYSGPEACTSITDPAYRQHAKNGSELLPQSGERDLTAQDISQMGGGQDVSLDQVWKAKNEIFMRAGRPFQTKELADYATQQGYQPRLNYSDSDPTPSETTNAAMLNGLESYMRKNKMQQADAETIARIVNAGL